MTQRVQPIHPSEYILEEMEARGWDYQDLAIEMHWRSSPEAGGFPPHEWVVENWPAIATTILALEMYAAAAEADDLRRNVRLGEMADEVDRGFGVGPGFFAALESAYLLQLPSGEAKGGERT